MFSDLLFPREEYLARVERARTRMAAAGLDCLLLTDDRNTFYFSGFSGPSPIGGRARPRFLLLPLDRDPVYLCHRSTENCVREMTWIADVRTYSDLSHAPVADLRSILSELGARRVGLELGREQRLSMPVADLLALQATPGMAWADAALLLWRLRAVKSPLEIERIRTACRITGAAYDQGLPQIRPGMTEREIAGLLSDLMSAAGAQGTWCWVITSDYHRIDGVPRNRCCQPGDLVFVDMGANVGGYWSDFSRAGVIGGPTPAQAAVQEKIGEVCAIGVEACRVGVTLDAVNRKVDAAMAARGLTFNSLADRYGHGMGMEVTEWPSIMSGEQVVIEPGMVLTIEPGHHRPDGMFHLEENFLVTAQGVEILSVCDRHLRSI